MSVMIRFVQCDIEWIRSSENAAAVIFVHESENIDNHLVVLNICSTKIVCGFQFTCILLHTVHLPFCVSFSSATSPFHCYVSPGEIGERDLITSLSFDSLNLDLAPCF
jgi:hypothetical protein